MIIQPDHPEFWNPERFLPMLQIRTKSRGLQPFNLWDHQRILAASVMQAYAQQKWLVHIKPRQEGSSTFFTGVAFQHAAFRTGCHVAIIGNKKKTAKSLAEIANRFYKSCPLEIRPKRHGKLQRTLEFQDIDSKLDIASVQDDEPLRGETVQMVLGTELSSWQESGGGEVWASVLNAVPEDGGFFIAESTPKHHGDQLHMLCMDSEKSDSKWLKVFIPWTMVDEYQKDVPPGWKPSKIVQEYWDEYPMITPQQAYWMQISGLQKCNRKIDKFKQEYPINEYDCWAMTGDAVYDQTILRQWIQDIDGGTGLGLETDPWVRFQEPIPADRYIIFCDPASSWSERDHYGVVILNITKCEQAAEYLGHMSAYQMAQNLAKWGRMYNEATIYVEANGVGESVLSHLVDNPNISYRRVFHRTPNRRGRSRSRTPGWWSSVKTKREAEGFMQQLIEDESITIHSSRSLRQLLTYRGQWAQRARDASGGHYDLATAWAGAAWAYMNHRGSAWKQKKKDPAIVAAEAFRRLQSRIDGLGRPPKNTPWGNHL